MKSLKLSRTYSSGFTIPELIVVIAFAALLFILFSIQKANVEAMRRDEQAKSAINAIYYALEEGYYAQNGYYPDKISEQNLKVIDPTLFTDPFGVNLGKEFSIYHYEPAHCDNGKCKEYTLRAKLEKEDDYIKRNRS